MKRLRKFLGWLLCTLGQHDPVNQSHPEDDYASYGVCSRCREPLMQDHHWLHGDGKWRKCPKEYRWRSI